MIYKNIVFMKYGTHAGDLPETIISNKINEVSLLGHTFWGYGGTTCHPTNQIQPFLSANNSSGEKTYLLLSRINSVWTGNSSRAMFYSNNQIEWLPIPEDNVVTGSKFALICTSFESCEFELDLSQYQVPIGKSKGQLLSSYICGHTTKGCGVLSEFPMIQSKRTVHISAIATIKTAVFLR